MISVEDIKIERRRDSQNPAYETIIARLEVGASVRIAVMDIIQARDRDRLFAEGYEQVKYLIWDRLYGEMERSLTEAIETAKMGSESLAQCDYIERSFVKCLNLVRLP